MNKFLSSSALLIILGSTSALAQTATPYTPAPAFEQVLAQVYQDNPQLKAERDSLKQLDEKVSQASAGFRPTLSANGELGEQRVSTNNSAWLYGKDQNIGLTAIQSIYNGATIGQWHASKARVMAGRSHLLAAEQSILLNVITAWLDMCEKEKLYILNHDNYRLTQNYLSATQERFKAGDGTQTDIALAESRSSEAEARFAMADAARATARANYERMTGLKPQHTDFPNAPINIPHSEDEAVELAKNNPQLEQAHHEVEATDYDIDSAVGARLPYVFLRGSMNDQRSPELGLAELRDDSITINVTFPLYQGGAEYSREREAKIAHEKSRYASIDTERSVTEEARQAWNNYHAALLVTQSSNHASSSAQKALNGISEEQKRGTRTLTEVLDAQSQSVNAQQTEIQAQKNVRLEAYKLMASVGRLNAQGLNLPTTVYDPEAHYNDVAGRWFGTSIASDEK